MSPSSAQLIQRDVELEYIDPLLSENTEKPVPCRPGDESAHPFPRQVACLCDARHLKFGGGRGYVRIEAAR